MSPAVRRLGRGDRQAFRAMNALFGRVFEEPETFGAAPPSDAYVDRLLADPLFIALVAEDNTRTVGALAAYELRKYEQERSEVYIYDLAVAEDCRRQGVATALIEALKPIALEAGAWVIFVQADPPDLPAVALYDKLGLREEVLHFDIPLPTGGPEIS